MNLRPVLLVPTYNNPATIADVVLSLLAETTLPVLVVDDGSTPAVRAVLAARGVADARLTVVRHARNRGKGVALKTGFAEALARGYTHALTFDGDGQHVAAHAARLTAAAEQHPWSLIIGARAFPDAHVPGASRFGRAFSNFWIRYETGVAVGDSQSGMRVYPLFHVQALRFLTARYDFEVEILTRLLWAGAGLVEVPVGVVYPEPAQRVSHFDKGRDNVRISLLNIGLVTISLFRRHLDAAKLALATLVAPPLAALPLGAGGRFALMALTTVILRLNGWVVLFWFLLSLLGLHRDWPWLGVAAGSAGLAASIHGIGRSLAKRSRGAWTGKSRGGKFGNYFLWQVSRRLGLGATYVCLAFITPYFYLFAPRAKRASLEYFAAIRPEAGRLRRRAHVLRQFYTFGMVLLDRLFQSFYQHPMFDVAIQGKPVVDRASAGGRGVIVLTAHMGGWDLSTRFLATNHLDRASVVAEFVADGVTSDSTVRAAEHGMIQRASLHNEAAPILAYKDALDQGQVVGMMGDRPMTGERLALVPFLGRLAAFDLTPFRLGSALEVEVVYCFAVKTGYKSYRMLLEPSLPRDPSLSRVAAAEAAAVHFAGALERHLRAHPHQWFNFYPFFSTRPA